MKQVTLLAPLLLACLANIRAELYTVVDLGGEGSKPRPYALNSSGVAVGYTDSGYGTALVFDGNGSFTNLGSLDPTGNWRSATATGINDSGVIVGRAAVESGGYHAAIFSGTGFGNVDLGTLSAVDWYLSGAQAVNASGTVVGWAERDDRRIHATRFSGTGTGNIDLGTLGGDESQATAINASGVIVGNSRLPGDFEPNWKAVRYGQTPAGNKDLGTLGGRTSNASAINDKGVIVGAAEVLFKASGQKAYFTHAVIFSGTGTGNTDLGTLYPGAGSYAYGINNSGVIVGSAGTDAAHNFRNHAFVYRDGRMRDLNSLVSPKSGRVFTEAFAINNKGQIAVVGSLNGNGRAFRLDPVEPPPSNEITATARPLLYGKIGGSGNFEKGIGTYKKGKTVSVIAYPKNKRKFVKWIEKGKTVSLKAVYTFTVTGDRKLVAVFK